MNIKYHPPNYIILELKHLIPVTSFLILYIHKTEPYAGRILLAQPPNDLTWMAFYNINTGHVSC